jgi:hypothetical protein
MCHSFFYDARMIEILREKLKRLPLQYVLLFFGTLLMVGWYRHGSLAAYWVLGWAAFFAAKLIITVKRKVDQQSRIKN